MSVVYNDATQKQTYRPLISLPVQWWRPPHASRQISSTFLQCLKIPPTLGLTLQSVFVETKQLSINQRVWLSHRHRRRLRWLIFPPHPLGKTAP